MADVFISYHEESAGELAEQIADALDAAGISAWCARRDLIPGEVFAEEIPKRIHECRLFLLILNERVYDSAHMRTEVGIAFNRVNKGENIRIFPLNLDNCPLKGWLEYYLIHPQGVKFPAQPDEQQLQWLVERIAKTFNRETQPAPPQATPEPPPVEIIKCGQCGDNVTFTLDKNGVLTISGNGSMWDFPWNFKTQTHNIPWESTTITEAKIQNGVTVIGVNAFFNCAELKSVTILDSVTEIRGSAFQDCAKLISVTLPDSVTTIRNAAFSNCVRLTNITIPDSMKKIEFWAFKNCDRLKNVSVPANVEIHPKAFPNWVHVTRRE